RSDLFMEMQLPTRKVKPPPETELKSFVFSAIQVLVQQLLNGTKHLMGLNTVIQVIVKLTNRSEMPAGWLVSPTSICTA
ncbi:hypothetical protein ACFL6S_06395, partial [Candidatus Poribacteria bacterium]